MNRKMRFGAALVASLAIVLATALPAGAATGAISTGGSSAVLDGTNLVITTTVTIDPDATDVSFSFNPPSSPPFTVFSPADGVGTFLATYTVSGYTGAVGDTVEFYASYTLPTGPVGNEFIGEVEVTAKPPVSNPPVATPLGMESAPADPMIGFGLTAFVIGLVAIPFVVGRSRRNATQR